MREDLKCEINEGVTLVFTVCPICKKERIIEVPTKEFLEWRGGKLIQEALPELTPEEREMLSSGLCHDCYHDLMYDNEDEEYEDEYGEADEIEEMIARYEAL